MCAREDRAADHVNILFNGGGDDRLRGAADSGVDHLKALVAQAARQHLGTTVMAVQARLGDQDADRSGTFSHTRILPAGGCLRSRSSVE